MKVGSNTLNFTYDAAGVPLTVTYNGTKYYYTTNIQGDVVAILDSSGTQVASYTYDAWGNCLTAPTSGVGLYNPLRYRGYVYDRETELYYLQSRYYDPKLGRFLNADAFIATGQGFTGNNMFAYCGNNPVRHIDTTGTAWQEFKDAFDNAIKESKAFFAMAATVSQVDSPMFGLADVVASLLFVVGFVECLSSSVHDTTSRQKPPKFNGSSNTTKDSTPSEIGSIAGKYGKYQCKEAAESMVFYLEGCNRHGEIITIVYKGGRGYILSDLRNDVISTNGVHVGVKYNGIVYCNVHPLGLPESMWLDDFHATGTRHILRCPF